MLDSGHGGELHLVPVRPSVQGEAGGCNMTDLVAVEAPAIVELKGFDGSTLEEHGRAGSGGLEVEAVVGVVVGAVDVGNICGRRRCDRGTELHLVPVGPSMQIEACGRLVSMLVAVTTPAIDAMAGQGGCDILGRRRWFGIGMLAIGGQA